MENNISFTGEYDMPYLYEYLDDGYEAKFKLPTKGYVTEEFYTSNTFCKPDLNNGVEETYLHLTNRHFKNNSNSYDSTIIGYDANKTYDPRNLKENDAYPFGVMNIHYDKWEEFYYDLLLSGSGVTSGYKFFDKINAAVAIEYMKNYSEFNFENVVCEGALYLPTIMNSVSEACKDNNSKYETHEAQEKVKEITKEFFDKLSELRGDIMKNNIQP